tara:strand:- start:247 stop:486 length:240 start_codon:yes stop_codon:yes gene_type:complete
MERYFVKSMRRLTRSAQGNPRFKFIVIDREGATRTLHTEADAGWVYAITHGWENRMIEAFTRETKKVTFMTAAQLAERF